MTIVTGGGLWGFCRSNANSEEPVRPACRLIHSIRALACRIRLYCVQRVAGLFNLDLLDDEDPFEIDRQAAHLVTRYREDR